MGGNTEIVISAEKIKATLRRKRKIEGQRKRSFDFEKPRL